MGYKRDENGKQKADKAKRPRPGIPLDKEIIRELIKKTNGNITAIADAMGTTRVCIRDICKRTPDLQATLDEARERRVDKLEACVWERAIESKDTSLQIFLLKTQAKHRGYDQDGNNSAKDIASAAFDYILNKSKNPVDPSQHS